MKDFVKSSMLDTLRLTLLAVLQPRLTPQRRRTTLQQNLKTRTAQSLQQRIPLPHHPTLQNLLQRRKMMDGQMQQQEQNSTQLKRQPKLLPAKLQQRLKMKLVKQQQRLKMKPAKLQQHLRTTPLLQTRAIPSPIPMVQSLTKSKTLLTEQRTQSQETIQNSLVMISMLPTRLYTLYHTECR